jgi:hypothetical protein
MVTALCLSYLANTFAEPSSLRSTKFDNEINSPVMLDLTKSLLRLSLSFLSKRYC